MRTRALYLRAAVGLLDVAGAFRRGVPDMRDVRRMLRRTPGARASLGPFVTWLAATGQAPLVLPRRRRPDPKRRERRTIAMTRGVVRALVATDDPARGRALLAFCLSRLSAVPLGRVLALRGEHVRRGGPIELSLGEDTVRLPAEVAAPFERWVGEEASGYLFRGRSGLRPASTSGVRHHVAGVLGRRRVVSGAMDGSAP